MTTNEELWLQIKNKHGGPDGRGVPRERGTEAHRFTLEELQDMNDRVGQEETVSNVEIIEGPNGEPQGLHKETGTAIFASPIIHWKQWPLGWTQEQLEDRFEWVVFFGTEDGKVNND